MRRFLRVSVLAFTALVALFYPLLAPTPHRIDETHFGLVQVGMTRAEVEAIFGVPAGSYDWAVLGVQNGGGIDFFPPALGLVVRSRNSAVVDLRPFVIKPPNGVVWAPSGELIVLPEPKTWISRHGAFRVYFDQHGSLISKDPVSDTRIDYPWQRWRRWVAK